MARDMHSTATANENDMKSSNGDGKKTNGTKNATTLICRLVGERIEAAVLQRRNGQLDVCEEVVGDASELAAITKRIGRKAETIALLPKSEYLIKTLEIPEVSAREVRSMLELEVEASLPQEFGAVQISYCQLPDQREGCLRYEVYIARESALNEYMSALESFAIKPAALLPSATVWRSIYDRCEPADMLVCSSGLDGQIESAVMHEDQTLSVRVFSGNGDSDLSGSVAESVKFLQMHCPSSDGSFTIGWLIDSDRPDSYNGHVSFKTIDELFCNKSAEEDGDMATEGRSFLGVAAVCIAGSLYDDANLRPRGDLATRQKKAIFIKTAIGAGSSVIAVLVAMLSLHVFAARYERQIQARSNGIKSIAWRGEAVGRRIAQLKEIRAAKITQRDLFDILTGLYGATPSGVTYSLVKLSPTGELRLQGQAESMSQPFLLPERLEAQPMFSQVRLDGAGQVKKAGGTVAEFRIGCVLSRSQQ